MVPDGRRTSNERGGTEGDDHSTLIRPDVVLSFVSGTFAVAGLLAVSRLQGELPLHAFLFEAFMHVGLAVAILLGGVYLHRSELPQSTWWNVVGGYVAGICFINVLLVWASISELLTGAPLRTLWNDFVFFGNLGGLFGFVAGISRARSRYNQHLLEDLEARQRELERQNERLDEFASVVSHDLRNPLTVAKGRLDLLDGDADDEHVTAAVDALERMETLIDDLLELARAGEVVDDLEPVEVETQVENAWRNVDTDGAELTNHLDGTVLADRTRLVQLFENLFRNAVEHGSTSPRSQAREDAVEHGSTSPPSQAQGDAVEHGGDAVTVRVGALNDGFYVEDDGPGIPEDEREEVLHAGYTTAADGNGFGLSIVAKIAESQGWDVTVTESETGGARFEFTGVETAPSRSTSETA